MSENRLSICIIGGSKANLDKLSGIIDANELSTTYVIVKDADNLLEQIEKNQCHLIMGSPRSRGYDIFDAAETINSIETHIPAIGIYKSTKITVADAMQSGLSDFVDIANQRHLQLVVERELRHIELSIPATHISGKDFTGLFSRLQFIEYLKKLDLKKISKGGKHALLYLQLDNFAWINETNGILVGDIFLKTTARVISSVMKENDVTARYQGGSFILLIKASGIKKLSAKADMIREAIVESISEVDDVIVSSSCSIGMFFINDATQSIAEIISKASLASERAKVGGGDAVHLHKETTKETKDLSEDNAWDSRIIKAFENDMFLLFFQPIISLNDDINPRYEVFLRMVDNDENIISPGTFLPHAERAGLMADIDRRVIIHALQKAEKEQKNGQNIEIFIKLSSRSLNDKIMPSWINSILKGSTVQNKNLVFEITESLALTQLAQTRHLVNSLKSLGCKVALDHFGTRLKSFRLLEQIPVDYLKVDGTLVQHLTTNKGHQAIVRKISRIAKQKNIPIIAEAVQEASFLPIIWQYSFSFVQGYFLQVPDEEMNYDFSNTLM